MAWWLFVQYKYYGLSIGFSFSCGKIVWTKSQIWPVKIWLHLLMYHWVLSSWRWWRWWPWQCLIYIFFVWFCYYFYCNIYCFIVMLGLRCTHINAERNYGQYYIFFLVFYQSQQNFYEYLFTNWLYSFFFIF